MTETLETSNVAATIARCCGRGRPRSDCARPARCGVRRQVAAFLPRRGERKYRGNWETGLPVSGTTTIIVSSPTIIVKCPTKSNQVIQGQSSSTFFKNAARANQICPPFATTINSIAYKIVLNEYYLSKNTVYTSKSRKITLLNSC